MTKSVSLIKESRFLTRPVVTVEGISDAMRSMDTDDDLVDQRGFGSVH